MNGWWTGVQWYNNEGIPMLEELAVIGEEEFAKKAAVTYIMRREGVNSANVVYIKPTKVLNQWTHDLLR